MEYIKGFNKAQRAYDNMCPPDYDYDEECPECGEMFDGIECECGYVVDNEPDIPDYDYAPEPDCWAHGMDA